MKKAVTGFFMSWGMFCAIPCPLKLWSEDAKLLSVVFIPFIGAVIGLIWSVCAVLLRFIGAPLLITAALLTICPYLLSGFIHLDGFMDCCDAILSRRDLAERQRILKDSHTGAFAVICLCILMLCSFAVFGTLTEEKNLWALLFIPAAARCVSAVSVLAFKPIGHSGYARAFETSHRGYIICSLCILAFFDILPVVLFGTTGLCAAAASLASFAAVMYARGQLGGMSGDISGYGITIGECVGAAVFVLL